MSGIQQLLLGGSPAGYQIERSLRFNSADTAYLNRTPASAGNRKTWTWSGWIKRSSAKYSLLFAAGNTNDIWNSGSTTQIGWLANTDSISVYDNGTYFRTTTQVFRDFSAWGHLVVAVDTTQATAANRVKMYWNGVEITAFATSNNPTQNADTFVNAAHNHVIGGQQTNVANSYYNGYVTEVNFIDGQALTPSDFGETDSATGVWKPKKFSGTYGTNGFYLNFSDNSNTTAATLGKDSSGNGNNWTPNLFSVTAGTGNDSLVDTPTSYGTDTGAGGEVRGNYCTADVLTPQGSASGLITVANGNLQLSYTSSNYAQRFGNFRVNSGKWYYEWTVTNIGFPSLQCGWFSGQAYPTLTGATGQATGGSAIGYFSGSNLSVNTYSGGLFGSSISSQTWSNGDVIMVAVDFDAGKIWFGKNGSFYSSGNPGSGTNPTDTWTASSSLNFAPWFVTYGTSTDTYVNFGQRPFAHTAPSGFKALCTQNLPTPTIGATSTTQANNYFNPVLYTGNSSNDVTVTNTFASDLVWLKSRSNSDNHYLQDIVRGFGASKSLSSNTTGSEGFNGGSPSTQNITTTSTSLRLQGGDFTTNTYTYVAWNWKANGAGSSNTSGSITSTVSANTTAGFSIATYTGNGTGGATVGHGLGVSPSWIIIKSKSNATNWMVWTDKLTTNYALEGLNTTGEEVSGGSPSKYIRAVSSTTFTIGNDVSVNQSASYTYVAYCFAAVAGYSAFGSYSGNNSSTDGPFVYLGFRPRFIMIKSTSAGTDWVMMDSARNTYNLADTSLYANSSSSESTIGTVNDIDFLSNGFKLRNNTGFVNASQTYIYAAFAESPFKYSLAR